jgi:hypothetical protein
MNKFISQPNIPSKKFKHRRYNTELCSDDMSFEDCELAILRKAVDETDELKKAKVANSDDVKNMIRILEDFLVAKKLVCYGGTAINNILPKYDQFYNRDVEVPDYDFYSNHARDHAIELANLYYKAGYTETEAKSGVHKGTFKVFVNFIPMADITQLHPVLYDSIQKSAITIAGIKYTPPDYLRMSMFLELSRPAGDVSRWEKVLKRLTLLNKHYPLKTAFNCENVDFQRKLDKSSSKEEGEQMYYIVRDCFIEQGVVFFGGYASSLYSRYMDERRKRFIQKVPDFDVLSDDPDRCALIVCERLRDKGFKNVHTVEHVAYDDVIPRHVEIMADKQSAGFIFEPIACYNYNTVQIGPHEINVATIDTMLSFYLAFLYTDAKYFDKSRILCMAKFLFDVEQKNRLEQKGLLKRFSIMCYGKQKTLEDMRAEKAEMFKLLKGKKGTDEYDEWFFKYVPKDEKKKGKKEETIEKEKKEDSVMESMKQLPKKTIRKVKRKKARTVRQHDSNFLAKQKLAKLMRL